MNLNTNQKIILFDGVCNLCNNFVLQVIKYDTKNNFVFASLQSTIGQKITTHLGIDVTTIDSIILYEPTVAYYVKSSAALKIMQSFGKLWFLTRIFWIFPTFFRDFIYDFIAKNRYKWFGKKESCMVATLELKAKFLE